MFDVFLSELIPKETYENTFDDHVAQMFEAPHSSPSLHPLANVIY